MNKEIYMKIKLVVIANLVGDILMKFVTYFNLFSAYLHPQTSQKKL